MMFYLKKALLDHFLALVASAFSYLAARWLLDLSTPEKDWETFCRWMTYFEVDLRWYRGAEVFHQLRGARLLRSI